MGKLSDVYAEQTKKVRVCRVKAVQGQLDAEDLATFNSLLENDATSSWAIYQMTRAAGIEIGKESIYEHRKGTCTCG